MAVWERMGRPRPGKQVIVVAGTNGKGSTVTTICSLLGALGYRYGSYTTPHIHRYNERVRVGGLAVDDESLVAAFVDVEAAREETSLSYFEFGTLAAIRILEKQQLDFAVMEIGLGGRLDAVNVLDSDCAVITPIGLDHQEYLGEDRESIGFEKAGIMRRGRPVVCGDPDPPKSVTDHADRLDAPLVRLDRDFSVDAEGDTARYRVGGREFLLPRPVLEGDHQLSNAVTALAAVVTLDPDAASNPDALERGIRSVRLKGRFEQVAERPDVWIDVGHNPMGAEVVCRVLRSLGGGAGRRMHCVLGMLADKDAESVARVFRGVITDWYCATLHGDRGQSGERLAARVSPSVGVTDISAYDSVAKALESALKQAAQDDGVLVFGSFHTADEADRMMVNWPPGTGHEE